MRYVKNWIMIGHIIFSRDKFYYTVSGVFYFLYYNSPFEYSIVCRPVLYPAQGANRWFEIWPPEIFVLLMILSQTMPESISHGVYEPVWRSANHGSLLLAGSPSHYDAVQWVTGSERRHSKNNDVLLGEIKIAMWTRRSENNTLGRRNKYKFEHWLSVPISNSDLLHGMLLPPNSGLNVISSHFFLIWRIFPRTWSIPIMEKFKVPSNAQKLAAPGHFW